MSGKTQLTVDKENLTTTLSREFNAPVAKLYEAHSNAEMIPKWWGVSGSTKVDQLDFTVGGKWRYVDGESDAFKGEFKEIVPNEKIIWTFEYEGFPGNIITETMNFEDLGDGRSKLFTVSKYDSIEALEGMLASGMEGGATQTWDQLEKVLQMQK